MKRDSKTASETNNYVQQEKKEPEFKVTVNPEAERIVTPTIELKVEESPQSPRDLAIDGNLICQHLGLKPSKEVGQLLHTLLHYVWENPEQNNPSALLMQAEIEIKKIQGR